MVISRSSNVNQGHSFKDFCSRIVYLVAKNGQNMNMNHKDLPKYTLQLLFYFVIRPPLVSSENHVTVCRVATVLLSDHPL